MTLKITIEMDNEAFTDGRSDEAARILREYADRIAGQDTKWMYHRLFDGNGNCVGKADVEE